MVSLFRILSGPVFKQWILFVTVFLLGSWGLSRFVPIFPYLIIGVYTLGFLLSIRQAFVLFSRNLDWIMAMPLSKWKVLGFHYGFSVFIQTMFLISCSIVIGSVVYFTEGAEGFSSEGHCVELGI